GLSGPGHISDAGCCRPSPSPRGKDVAMRHYVRWSLLLVAPLLLAVAAPADAQQRRLPTMGLRSAQPPRTVFVQTINRGNANMVMRGNMITPGNVVTVPPFGSFVKGGFNRRLNRALEADVVAREALALRFGTLSPFGYNPLLYAAANPYLGYGYGMMYGGY